MARGPSRQHRAHLRDGGLSRWPRANSSTPFRPPSTPIPTRSTGSCARASRSHFPDPDRLDIGRLDNRHIAFGFGIHFCLGAPLARVEGRLALGALLERMPRLRLADAPLQWRESSTLRGLKALPVEF